MDERPLLVIDGTGLLVRCSRAARQHGLSTSGGVPTGALMMFINSIARKLRAIQPSHAIVCWDGYDPLAWRRKLYRPYKANRVEGTRALYPLGGRAIEFCEAAWLCQAAVLGFEADDVIAAVVRAADGQLPGKPIIIASDDQDMEQLTFYPQVRVQGLPAGAEEYYVDAVRAEASWGVPPLWLPKLRALAGDTTDNIPGLPGVGPVRAARMLHEAGLRWPLPESLLPDPDQREMVVTWRNIIDLVVPLKPPELEVGADHFWVDVPARWDPRVAESVREFLEKYELSSIAKRLAKGGVW